MVRSIIIAFSDDGAPIGVQPVWRDYRTARRLAFDKFPEAVFFGYLTRGQVKELHEFMERKKKVLREHENKYKAAIDNVIKQWEVNKNKYE